MASSVLLKQQHAVAVPLPFQGHLNPLMRFCKLLASQGVRVTFVNIDPIHHRIQELQQQQQQDDIDDADDHHEAKDPKIRRAHIPIEGLDLSKDFRVSFEPFLEALNSIAPHLEGLIHQLNCEGPPVTCLISDIGMTMPTQKVADMFDIPRIVLYTNLASFQLLISYVMQGQRTSTKQVLEGLKRREQKEVFCDGLPGLPTLYNDELPHFKHVVDDNEYMWGFFERTRRESNSRAYAMVVNSFDALEASAFKALSEGFSLPIYGVGPLVEPLQEECTIGLWKDDDACLLWLDKQPTLSVLYVSFGSITLLSQPQFDEIVAALLSSQQRFLWVFRPDLVEHIPYPTFALDMGSKSQGRGCVVDWAPQLRVLSHPSVGGFITHCGWNSVIEAITHGVPMLCWPYFGDQFLIAKYVVEEWKVGLQFKANEESGCMVEKGEIERGIKALMEGEEGGVVRKNITHLKEEGRRSLLPGGISYNNVGTLIKSLSTRRAPM